MFRSWRSRPRLTRSKRLALALLLTLLLCGGGSIAVQLNQRAVAVATMTQTICVALDTAPRIRFGMYWTAPIFSSIPSLAFAPMQTCIELPYSTAPRETPWFPREWLLIS
jgi:hypothetical protein